MRQLDGRGLPRVQDAGYRELQNDGLLLYGPGAPCVRHDHHHFADDHHDLHQPDPDHHDLHQLDPDHHDLRQLDHD